MNKFILAFSAAVAILLTGCETIRTVTVTKHVYIPVTVSSELTTKFTSPGIPFSPEQYLEYTDRQRRSGLLDMIGDRDTVIENCNIRLFAIEKQIEDTVKSVEARNKDGK